MVTVSGPNVVPVFSVKFDGVNSPSVTIVSATELLVEVPPGNGTVDVLAHGFGTDTMVDGYTYIGGGNFVVIDPGTPGTYGMPVLAGSGDLTPGGAGFQLDISNVLENTSGIMWVSLTQDAIPFMGGTLYPFPFLLEIPLFIGPSGSLSLPAGSDPDLYSLDIVLQAWFADPASPSGIASGTNGLVLEFPDP